MSTETAPESTELHAVFYTDGGCRPASRGMAGWGLHGYIYTPVPAKQGTGCKEMVTSIGYNADLSGKPEISLVKYIDGFGAIPESTNNAAEATALARALDLCISENIRQVHILADSTYALNGHRDWMHSWRRNNWMTRTGQPIPNQAVWERIHRLNEELTQSGTVITTEHIKGHSGKLGNEAADTLATNGVISGFNGNFDEVLLFTDAKGYWKNDRGNNRFLAHPYRYFSTQAGALTQHADGRTIYYTGKIHRDDLEMIGKKISDSSVAILYLQEPDSALQVMDRAFDQLGAGRYQGLIVLHMSTVLSPSIRESLLRFNDRLLIRDHTNRRITDASDNMIGYEAYPPRLAFRLVDTLNSLERMFQSYLSGSQAVVTTTDITDILYESVDAGKPKSDGKSEEPRKTVTKLKSSLKPGHRTVETTANYARASGGTGEVKLVLTLDQDIPDRNTLAALADTGIKVTLITWAESEKAIRYATVLEVNGDAAIWAGVYANLKLVAP